MKKIALAATVLALLAGLTACQKDVTMWSSCRPAADGNPTGTDGTYVLACRNGTWEPVMTVKEWLDISAGKRITIAPLPTRPTTTTTSTTTSTTTTSTTTTTTTTTTVPSTEMTIDLAGATDTVGANNCWNCADVSASAVDPYGNSVTAGLSIADTGEAADGGYQFLASALYFAPGEFCLYPVVAVRGRATIGETTYRLDWDRTGDEDMQAVDMPGPWDRSSGDQPTLVGESITIDYSQPTCFPF